MLLEFKTTNYKSFRDELVFSLIPAPKQKGLDYSILKTQVGKKTYRGLCSSVIYGPNASGKSNIIGAMDAFKSIVFRGHIRNEPDLNNPNVAAGLLELIPNNKLSASQPVSFSIAFIENGLYVEYSFSADLGKFLSPNDKRKIISETLKINNRTIFLRGMGLEVSNLGIVHDLLINAFEQNEASAIALAKNNLNDEELFLTSGFKTMFSSKLVSLITDWLKQKFMVIYRANDLQIVHKFSDSMKKSIYVEKTVNEAANCFGIDSNELGYLVDDESDEAKLYSMFKRSDEKGTAILAEMFESFGTIRFINTFPLVVSALANGGTLVVDEFDASLHPMALMSIINIFHNDEINTNHAQLVFNTHNPIFLNANLFRRDEIKFVERNEDTFHSALYSLSDFGTVGKKGVRKNEDYMKNYFIDRYGAIKAIDFTPILENLTEGAKEA